MRKLGYILSGVTAICGVASANAASLQVSPILVDVATEGASATMVTLKNSSAKPVNTQLRVFRWSQVNGEDRFEETTDVAASPPMVTMRPNGEYVIRVVRTNRSPVQGEESYRLVADELPDPVAKTGGAVSLLVRHSVPVFFRSSNASPAQVAWNVSRKSGKLVVEGRNSGDRRVRVSRLKAEDGAGNAISYGDGLVGYVLGRSSAVWTSRTPVKGFAGSARLSLTSETGPIAASVVVR